MGRRPNQLVLEFFQRGRKLEDSSNRYEHTCKRCAEVFPKGRIDSLMSHLLRRCPNVTQQDRELVFRHMQHTPDKSKPGNVPAKQNQNTDLKEPQGMVLTQSMGMQSELQMNIFQPQSALDTLAEVSRRHLDLRQTVNGEEHVLGDDGRALAEQLLISQLQQANAMPTASTAGKESAGLSFYAPNVSSMEQRLDAAAIASSALAASPHVKTAPQSNQQSVNQFRPNTLRASDQGALDPQLSSPTAQTEPHFQSQTAQLQSHNSRMTWNPTPFSPTRTEVNLTNTSTGPTSGFGLPHKPTRSKARSRFTDNRRKEVQEIRKRGACIRCRMLKKPCSDDDPCNTCRNVESARLWKDKCLRTRLAEEFNLWSAGLYHARARREIPSAVFGQEHHLLPGRLQARFFSDSNLCMTFTCKQCHGQSIDPDLPLEPGHINDKNVFLLDESEGITDKIEEYINLVADVCIENEESHFLRATLQTAQILLRSEQQDTKRQEEHGGGRSCYNLQVQMLKDVIELWIETCVLSMPRNHQLQLSCDETKEHQQQPEAISSWTVEKDGPFTEHLLPSSKSYALIRCQLLAAMEMRGARLSKQIVNELERRLLQRQQVSRFSTFISAIILLSCVERMTAFYNSFDMGTNDSAWPLTEPPSRIWAQGERFADLLNMLLRMRALPPKTMQNSEGTLAAVQDYALPVQVQGRKVEEHLDEQTESAAAWLDPIELNVNDLMAKLDGLTSAKDDVHETWDMKFIAKVLLPEKAR